MIQIYLDSSDLKVMEKYADKVHGFTTNPSLMKKAGVKEYQVFAQQALNIADGKAISFEVTDRDRIEKQAEEISAWGSNVYVKIPVQDLVRLFGGINLNVTAVMTKEQISIASAVLTQDSIISVFAGRIADTGRDPCPTMKYAVDKAPCKVLWASAREVFNVRQAEWCGVDIITLSPDLIDKLSLYHGKDLTEYSRETAEQFYRDGIPL